MTLVHLVKKIVSWGKQKIILRINVLFVMVFVKYALISEIKAVLSAITTIS